MKLVRICSLAVTPQIVPLTISRSIAVQHAAQRKPHATALLLALLLHQRLRQLQHRRLQYDGGGPLSGDAALTLAVRTTSPLALRVIVSLSS